MRNKTRDTAQANLPVRGQLFITPLYIPFQVAPLSQRGIAAIKKVALLQRVWVEKCV